MNEHRGEISIGKDEWLPFFDLDGRYESAVEIDLLLRDSSEIWAALETQCVAGCCGIEAFEFWAEDVQKAAAALDVAAAVDKLERLRSAIEGSSAGVLLSRRMNSYFDKRQFLMLLDHLLRSFENAREA
jgi:Family of unknown function (DUF6331)